MKRSLPLCAAPWLAAALMSALPGPALATDGFANGHDLNEWCSHMDLDDLNWGLCVGSITAGHDVIMTYQNFADVRQVVCTTEETSRGDVVFAVVEYMKENPSELEYSLGDVVLSALVDKFPCP